MHHHDLLRWIGRRALMGVPVVVGVTVLTLTLIHMAPGDPIYLLAGDGGSPSYYDDMRAKYGLDRSLLEQFLRYATAVLTFDLGYSFMYQAPVSRVLREHAPASLMLGSAALGVASLVGVLAGAVAGLTDRVSATPSSAGARPCSMPRRSSGRVRC